MHIDWVVLLLGLLLVVFPGPLMIPARARLRSFENLANYLQSNRKHSRPWYWMRIYLLDPFRGAVGAASLLHAFHPEPDASGLVGKLPLLITGAILALSMFGHMIKAGERGTLIAPVLFVAGMCLGLLPLTVALPAVLLGLATMLAFRVWDVFFLVAAIGVVGFGVLMGASKLLLIIAGGITFIPTLVAFLLNWKLTVPSRQ